MLTVVIDTNVMLSTFARHSPTAPLFRAIAEGKLNLALSTAILLEYEEVAALRGGVAFSARIMHWLSLVASAHQGVRLVQPSFQFSVITSDPDDNKFVDCAITADADYVITEDHHFAPLVNAGYRAQPITPKNFISNYLGSK
jgi:putative PIN family toxin of toxin-antitoxin system